MGQRIKEDKFGTISHSSGTISLAASILTIGGQQYVTSALSRLISTDVTLVALTRYMVYAVISGGSPALRISTNVNSVGPAGFTGWKLVGAFYSDGMSPVAFGSFVNLEGKPGTNYMPYQPVWSSSGTQPTLGASSLTGRVRLDGDQQIFDFNLLGGAGLSAGTGQYFFSAPFTIDPAKMSEAQATRTLFSFAYSLYGNQRGVVSVYSTTTAVALFCTTDGGANQSTDYGGAVSATNPAAFSSGNQLAARNIIVPVAGLSNTAIKDL